MKPSFARFLALTLGSVVGAVSTHPALANTVIYDVNLKFNPLVTEAGPSPGSVGTITGTVTLDTSTPAIEGVNLTEKTNDGATFGGAFGSPTYHSFNFTEYRPVTITFFGQPDTLATSSIRTGQRNDEFGGLPYIFLSFQTSATVFDGTLIGPGFQFDFPVVGGSVAPGNFDSITSETKYLYGNVTIAGVPELSTWAMILLGFSGVGFMAYRRAKPGRWGEVAVSD